MTTAPTPLHPQPLTKHTVVQLKALCQQLGIHGYSKLNKAQLVDAIERANPSVATATHLLQPLPCSPAPTKPNSSTLTEPTVTSSTRVVERTPVPSVNDPARLSQKRKRNTFSNIPTKNQPNRSSGGRRKTTTTTTTTKKKKKKKKTKVEPQGLVPTPPRNTQAVKPIPCHPSSLPDTQNQAVTKPTGPSLLPSSLTTLSNESVLTALSVGCSSKGKPQPRNRNTRNSVTRQTNVAHLSHPAFYTTKKFIPLSRLAAPTVSQAPSVDPVAGGPEPTLQVKHQLFPLPAGATRSDRVKHIENHFLDRLFLNLNGARDTHLTSSLVPTALPSLAFSGLHSELYDGGLDTFQVALRWWIARLHTTLQLGSAQEWSGAAGGMGLLGPDLAVWPAVAECNRVVEGIYLVVTKAALTTSWHALPPSSDAAQSKGREPQSKPSCVRSDRPHEPQAVTTGRYLVLASTGEVISTGTSSSLTQRFTIEGCDVRPDWYTYILSLASSQVHIATPGSEGDAQPLSAIMSHVRTKDSVSAPSGINRSWRDKAYVTNWELLRVAERAVLSSCVLNSFSGEKLSAMHMDAEWLCNTVDLNPTCTRSKTSFFAPASLAGLSHGNAASSTPVKTGAMGSSKIELYLPESHQVLSVHLPGAPTVPSLAVVHRASGKSDWVLCETGHVVGNEDEGIAELWQGILGCDRHGAEADVGSFWRGWEERVRGDQWE